MLRCPTAEPNTPCAFWTCTILIASALSTAHVQDHLVSRKNRGVGRCCPFRHQNVRAAATARVACGRESAQFCLLSPHARPHATLARGFRAFSMFC